VGQDVLRDGSQDAAEDSLVFGVPGDVLRVGNLSGDGTISRAGSVWNGFGRRRLLAINDAKELMGAEEGEDLGFPHEVVFSGEADGDYGGDGWHGDWDRGRSNRHWSDGL
jgi:hypothetical protein